jgi:hypothetical protein
MLLHWNRELFYNKFRHVRSNHRHLSNIDCLTACTTSLLCFISTVNGPSKKKPIQTGISSGHITNPKQYIWRLSISMEITLILNYLLSQKKIITIQQKCICNLKKSPKFNKLTLLATVSSLNTELNIFKTFFIKNKTKIRAIVWQTRQSVHKKQ